MDPIDRPGPLRVTVWGENVHEARSTSAPCTPRACTRRSPRGSSELLGDRVQTRTATLQEPEHGLGQDVLDATDVLTWWGHAAHERVDDAVAERVHHAVLGGMGLLVLHSGHYAKPFRLLLGTSCSLRWRNEGERELVWTVAPAHPDRGGRAAPDRDRRARDVRRAVRHPGARRAGLRQLLRGRRGLPRRRLLHARLRPDLLLQPRRPGVPDLPPPRRPPRHRQRRAVGRALPRAPRRAREPQLADRAGSRDAAARGRRRRRLGGAAAPRRPTPGSPASRSPPSRASSSTSAPSCRRGTTSRRRSTAGRSCWRSTASTR